jgi:hypothetical protein
MQMADGRVPYVDFQVEYPPGALWVFALPLELSDRYFISFHGFMLLVDLCLLLLMVMWSRRLWPDNFRAQLRTAIAYIAFTWALNRTLLTRFDLVVSALVVAGVLLFYARRARWLGPVIVGAAAGIKLWPLIVLPGMSVRGWQRDRYKGLASVALLSVSGITIMAAPFLWSAGTSMFTFLTFHQRRGLQLESTWASLVLLLEWIGVLEASIVHEFGALHVNSPISPFLTTLSAWVLVALVLAPQLIVLRCMLRGVQIDEHIAVAAVLVSTTGFLVGSKVLSPQFFIFLVPWLVLGARGRADWVMATLAILLTGVLYPQLMPSLTDGEPWPNLALFALLARNGLLAAIYKRGIVQLWRRGDATVRSTSCSPPAGAAPLEPAPPQP